MSDLRFGVAGVGYFGRHYVRLLQEGIAGAVLHGVTSPRPVAVADGVRRYAAFSDLIHDSAIDAVVIATPAVLHGQMAEAALAAGKHVLVEKPMVTALTDAKRLSLAVKTSGRIFMVGHQYLYNDYIRHLKVELARGAIGAVKYVYGVNHYLGPIREGITCFWETATHELAILDYLFGPTEIVESCGMSGGVEKRQDFASVSFSRSDGIRVDLSVSWFAPEKIRKMTFAGERGLARFDDRAEQKLLFQLSPYPAALTGASSYFFENVEQHMMIPSIAAGEPLRNELEHFVACVQEQKLPVTDFEHGMRITQLLDTLSRSFSQ